MTEWRDVPGYSQYEVSECGQIRKKPTLMGSSPNNHGYLTVRLTKGKTAKTHAIHRLVAIAFHGPCPPDKSQVNHKDKNRANNDISNLEWVTHIENIQHKYRVYPFPPKTYRTRRNPKADPALICRIDRRKNREKPQ